MKNLISISLLVLFVSLSYSQNKEKIIFLFENGKDILIEGKNENLFKIDKKHHFKFIKGKHKKNEVGLNSVKENIVSYDEFIKLNKRKKYPEFFSEYTFYVLIKENDSIGCLMEVEKIWLIEDKIID